MSCDANGQLDNKNIFNIFAFLKKVSYDASGRLDTKIIFIFLIEVSCDANDQLDTKIIFIFTF